MANEFAPEGLTATKPACAGSHARRNLWMSTQVDIVAVRLEARIHSPALLRIRRYVILLIGAHLVIGLAQRGEGDAKLFD